MFVVPQRKYHIKPKRNEGTCEDIRREKKKKTKSDITLDEGGRERNPFVEEREERFFAARVFVGEGEWGVCPKGEWWSLGTVGPSSS